MKKKTERTEQMNAKLTSQEVDRVQNVNNDLFGGKLNKSDILRFLVKVALVSIDSAKVETKTTTTLTVHGKVIDLT